MGPATLAIAHAVLVEGKKQVDVARDSAVTPARVSEAGWPIRCHCRLTCGPRCASS